MTESRIATVVGEGERVTVRVADVYDTDAGDLWSALTDPARLARWLAVVEGDLRVGGAFRARFTSSWEGEGRVEVCDAPRHLQVVTWEEGGPVTVIDAVLTAEGGRTRLVIEDRGLPGDEAPDHAAGWHVHLEDLGAEVAARPAGDWRARWTALRPVYRGRNSGE